MSLSPTDYDRWGGKCKRLNGKGAYVLQGYILAESPWDDSYNLGIYNCRPPSVHGEERAGDTGFPVINGQPHPQGFVLANWLWNNRDFFGIQLVIWNRRIISRANPTWRPYRPEDVAAGRASPHVDHVHWELNWWGYWNLTNTIINQHLPVGDPAPLPQPYIPEDDVDYVWDATENKLYGLMSMGNQIVKFYVTDWPGPKVPVIDHADLVKVPQRRDLP